MERVRPALLACLLTSLLAECALAQVPPSEIPGSRTPSVQRDAAPAVSLLAAKGSASPLSVATEPTSRSFPALQPRSKETAAEQETGASGSSKIAAPTITVISSLAVVLGLFAALVWASRKFGNGSIRAGALPNDVLQPLGSTPLDPRTRITMLRCGRRILVIAQGAGTTQTLCEIDDPEEVRQLMAACQGDAQHDFASALRSMEQEPVHRGYVGSEAASQDSPASRRRLFASV